VKSDLVPETAIDYDEVLRRGGRNYGSAGQNSPPATGRGKALPYPE